MSQKLTHQDTDEQDVNEPDVAHLAGYFDGRGSFIFSITKDDSYATGYSFRAACRLTVPTNRDDPTLGKFAAYCNEVGARYSVAEVAQPRTNSNTSDRLEIKQPASIRRFLEPLTPHFVTSYENSLIVLEEIVPAMEAGRHTDKEGLHDLMGWVDQIREAQDATNVKYDQDYFADEWSLAE